METKQRNIVLLCLGFILLGSFVVATTTISDTLMTSTGNLTLTSGIASITNDNADNALTIDQNADAGASTSTGGALLIENTGNVGSGLTVYSNLDSTASGHLVNVRTNNAAFDRNALFVDYTGTLDAFFINNKGSGMSNSALDIASSNNDSSTMGISGNESARGTLKISKNYPGGDDANAAALSIDLLGTGTRAMGIFVDSTGGGTLGSLIKLRDDGDIIFQVEPNGTMQIFGNRSAAPCNAGNVGAIYFDNHTFTHYGCNSTAWRALY